MKSALLWVTYGRDLPFFEASIASYQKFATGFDYAKVIVPKADEDSFRRLCDPAGVHVVGIDEPPGKGMVMHMAMIMLGETHFPDDAGAIFHMDADCVFNQPATPADWLAGDKPIAVFRDFDKLLERPVDKDEMFTFMGYTGRTIDLNRGAYLWKFAADFALGFPVPRQTMLRLPLVHLPKTYKQARQIIESRFNTDIVSHLLQQRNEWPQSFCEFETLGGVAHRYFENDYHWRQVDVQQLPPNKVTQTWSHAGLDATMEQDRPQIIAGVHRSPRQYFQSLGLLP